MTAKLISIVSSSRWVRRNALPKPWEAALEGWRTWLRLGGTSPATIRLRTDHMRSIARRSNSQYPRQLDLRLVVHLMSEKPWSLEHRRSVRTSLVSFCEWCVRNQLMESNPAEQLPRVRPATPKPRPAPDDVWRELLTAAPPRERLMARLAGEAGLRRAEVAQVHHDDLIVDTHGWSLIVHGKGDKQRVVPLTADLAADLRAYCPGGYAFPNGTGGHISAGWVGTMISRLMPPGLTMHTLRHRYASRGYSATGNLRAVQEALGHASVATTQIYCAVSSREVRLVAEAAADDSGDVA